MYFLGLYFNHSRDMVFLFVVIWSNCLSVWWFSFQHQWFDGMRTVFPFQSDAYSLSLPLLFSDNNGFDVLLRNGFSFHKGKIKIQAGPILDVSLRSDRNRCL